MFILQPNPVSMKLVIAVNTAQRIMANPSAAAEEIGMFPARLAAGAQELATAAALPSNITTVVKAWLLH